VFNFAAIQVRVHSPNPFLACGAEGSVDTYMIAAIRGALLKAPVAQADATDLCTDSARHWLRVLGTERPTILFFLIPSAPAITTCPIGQVVVSIPAA